MNLKNKIYKIISETLGVEENEITPESAFYEDLNVEAREIADLLLSLEQNLNIELPKEGLNEIKTIKDLLTLVEEASHEMVD